MNYFTKRTKKFQISSNIPSLVSFKKLSNKEWLNHIELIICNSIDNIANTEEVTQNGYSNALHN